LVAFSLLLPWYVIEVQGFTGLGKSGVAALGGLSWLVVALALGAGWSAAERIHRLVPVLASAGLVLIVIAKIASPPGIASDLASQGGADPFSTAFANAFAEGVGFGYTPAWGIWVAAAGAAMAAIGAIGGALRPQPAPGPDQSFSAGS
jgi:hypothetical protein